MIGQSIGAVGRADHRNQANDQRDRADTSQHERIEKLGAGGESRTGAKADGGHQDQQPAQEQRSPSQQVEGAEGLSEEGYGSAEHQQRLDDGKGHQTFGRVQGLR